MRQIDQHGKAEVTLLTLLLCSGVLQVYKMPVPPSRPKMSLYAKANSFASLLANARLRTERHIQAPGIVPLDVHHAIQYSGNVILTVEAVGVEMRQQR